MSTSLTIPRLEMAMTEGVLAEWLAQDGATIAAGDPLYAIESDKSTNEVEAPASGTLKITGVPGETYQVGDVIGTIE